MTTQEIKQEIKKAVGCLRWLPAYQWQRLIRRPAGSHHVHLMIAVADHFEPSFMPDAPGPAAGLEEQERRMDRWCREYPKITRPWRDADGQPLRHTYFYPAEQYEPSIIERLAAHCQDGWGEVEIHLHHGIGSPDTGENTRHALLAFRSALERHGCLSRWNGAGTPRYAFVHGNWVLANSESNQFCGVDNEMQILAETGCYADLTLPAAPDRAQVAKINALYECALPFDQRAPHRRGRDLRTTRPPDKFPIIIQGPLGIRGGRFPVPRIENGELTTANPPTLDRLRFWFRVPITVVGQPDWWFLKLHCHGMDPRGEELMFGGLIDRFLRDLVGFARDNPRYHIHFVTAREMANMILAACDGRDGNPGEYRNYRLQLVTPPKGI